jgi:hypothetical protein
MRSTPASDALRDSFSVVRFRDVVIVMLVGFIFEELLRSANLADAAAPTFGAAIVFAALLVPAATLVREHAQSTQRAVVERVIRPTDSPSADELEDRRRTQYAMLKDLDSALTSLMRGFVYAVLAVPFSAVALVHPQIAFGKWPHWWLHHSYSATLETSLVGISLALLVAAVLEFYPLTWVMIRRQNLKALLATLAPSAESAKDTGNEADRRKQEWVELLYYKKDF